MVYELKWLLPDGRRREIELDASDGRYLAAEGPAAGDCVPRPRRART